MKLRKRRFQCSVMDFCIGFKKPEILVQVSGITLKSSSVSDTRNLTPKFLLDLPGCE